MIACYFNKCARRDCGQASAQPGAPRLRRAGGGTPGLPKSCSSMPHRQASGDGRPSVSSGRGCELGGTRTERAVVAAVPLLREWGRRPGSSGWLQRAKASMGWRRVALPRPTGGPIRREGVRRGDPPGTDASSLRIGRAPFFAHLGFCASRGGEPLPTSAIGDAVQESARGLLVTSSNDARYECQGGIDEARSRGWTRL